MLTKDSKLTTGCEVGLIPIMKIQGVVHIVSRNKFIKDISHASRNSYLEETFWNLPWTGRERILYFEALQF